MSSKKKVLFSILLFFAIFTFSFTPYLNGAEEIRVGVLQDVTGRYSNYGKSVIAGCEYIMNEVNETGGIRSMGGAKIKLVIADSKSDTKRAVTELERLLTQEKVVTVIGPFSTSQNQAAAPLYDKYKIPGVAVICTGDTVFPLHLKWWRTIAIPTDDIGYWHADILHWLVTKHGYKPNKIAVFYPDNAYGKGVGGAASERLKKYGYKVDMDLPFDWNAPDFKPYILKLKKEGIDTIIQSSYTQDGILSHQARFALDYYPLVIGGIGSFSDDRLWKMVGGGEVAKKALEGPVFGASWVELKDPYKPLQEFFSKVKAKGIIVGAEGHDPNWFAYGAQGAIAVKLALEKAGTTNPEVINNTFRAMKIPKGTKDLIVPNFSPNLEWDQDGKPLNPMMREIQWYNGEKKFVYPEDIAEVKPRF
jgi:ABC-type branched-subunit amino acid transport system substrate-binding protein